VPEVIPPHAAPEAFANGASASPNPALRLTVPDPCTSGDMAPAAGASRFQVVSAPFAVTMPLTSETFTAC
jgi:hypothetical protein